MKSFFLALVMGIASILGCSAPPQPQPVVIVTPVPTAMPSPTPLADLAQSRTGAPLSVWGSPDSAYVAMYDPRLAKGLQCTIPPYTDVKVAERNVGWASWQLSDADKAVIKLLSFSTGQATDVVARTLSLDGRCSGYISGVLLTSP